MGIRSTGPRFRVFLLAITGIAVAAVSLACGGEDDAAKQAAQGAAPTTGAVQGGASPQSATEQVKTLSSDARKCIDLVKAERYIEAVDPCERAAKDRANMANAEFKQAYDEGMAEAKEASRAAALKAEADMREGKSAGEAARGAFDDALGGSGK
jgi:hypothetical protein